jgi:hypothetical protein
MRVTERFEAPSAFVSTLIADDWIGRSVNSVRLIRSDADEGLIA